MMPNPEFWRSFRNHADALAALIAAGRLREAFDTVESILERHGMNYCFDLTECGDQAVLVLTPEGDPARALKIDELLQCKPEIEGWQVLGRRPRKALDDAFVFVREIYDIDIGTATWSLRTSETGDEVVMFSAAVADLDAEQREGLVRTFLDHAVGESVTMSRVSTAMARPVGTGGLSASELVAALLGRQ